MSAKSLLEGIDEYRRYLLGEIPLCAREGMGAISDCPMTYFQAKLAPDDAIIKSLENTLAHPERLEMSLVRFREEVLLARRKRLAQAV